MRTVGRYTLTRELTAGELGARWLALCADTQTSHQIHRIDGIDPGKSDDAQRFGEAVARVAGFGHRHVLEIEAHGVDPQFGPWVATPFTGDQDGVLTLERLLRLKSGIMDPPEARRAMEHLLEAAAAGHAAGLVHGDLDLAGVSVSRGGSLQIDLYGLRQVLRPAAGSRELVVRVEARAMARIGYQLVTGLRVDEPLIPATRVVEGLHGSWDDWFGTALGEPGFTTAAHALHALRECRLNFELESARRRIARGGIRTSGGG